jgi:AcrR family transcriptional regulator
MNDSTKERILASATELFMRYGYIHMSVDDLAKSLRISKKTIYKHYSGKEELMDKVIDAFFADLNAKLTTVIASEQSYPKKLETFLKTVSTAIGGASKLLIAELATGVLWEKTKLLRENVIQVQAKKLIQIGIQEGIVRADIDAELFLLVVFVSLGQAASPQRLIQTQQSFDVVFEQVMDIVFTGILKR